MGASVNCTYDKTGATNGRQGGTVGTMGTHGKAQTPESVLDLPGTWCDQFGKTQIRAKLRNVCYNQKSNFNCQAGNQLRQILYKDIVRYAHESDMTAYQVIGVLESLKYDLLNAMQNIAEENEDEI